MTHAARLRNAGALVGLAAVGTSAAGLLGALPETLRVAWILLGAWIVPAFLLRTTVRRCTGATGSAAFAIAFFFTLSLHATFSEIIRLAGASFSVYANALTWTLLLAFAARLVLPRRRREVSAQHSASAKWHAILVCSAVGGLVAIAALARGAFTVDEDAFDHIGYVSRMLDFNSIRPDNVLALPVDADGPMRPDPRKGALHPVVAWTASLAGATPAAVFSFLPLVLYPAFVLAFAAFSKALLPTRRLWFTCVALFMVSYAGTAFQFAQAAAYGQNLAAAWYWVLAAVVFAGLRATPMRAHSIVLGVLAFGGALAHAGVALHAGLLAATLVLFAKWLGWDFRRAVFHALVLLGAVTVAVLLRLGFSGEESNPIHAHVQGVLFVGDTWFIMSPMEILRQYGMVFLGGSLLVPLLAMVARKRADARVIAALCSIPMVIAFVPPVTTALFAKGSYMVSRALLNAPLFAACAIVLDWMIGAARRKGLGARALAVAALAAWSIVFLRPAVDATIADAKRRAPPTDVASEALIRYVRWLPGASPTVLSDPATSYLLSAHTPHAFVALFEQHANPRDAYALDRLEAVRDVLSPYASVQRAIDACARYNVSFVVLNAHPPAGAHSFVAGFDPGLYPAALARLRAMRPILNEVHATPDFAVFKVVPPRGAVEPAGSFDPPPAPVGAESPALTACTVVAPERAFEVTGLAVEPPHASPGDSVTIVVGYRRDVATPFGLPFLAHVRFDHESIVSGSRYPGEKYVRRFEERRRAFSSRFRADYRPGAGVFEPDLWPMGAPLCERVSVRVPANALPGRYQVEMRVLRDSLLPNFHARDLLFDRDHYSGTPCATFEVESK